MSVPAGLGVVACLVQAAAFMLHAAHPRRDRPRLDASCWLMWAYGSAVFLALGLHVGAPPLALAPSAACVLAAFVMAGRASARACEAPSRPLAWVALCVDAGLMAGYGAFTLLSAVAGGPVQGPGLALVALAGASALTSAWPMLRATYAAPHAERPLAWFIWSAASGVVSLAAMAEGLPWAFLAYPAVMQVATLLVGMFALDVGESPTRSGAAA